MTPILFLVASLAVYRITYLLHSESGPFDMFGWLRSHLGVRYDEHSNPYSTGAISEMLLCFYCLSVWAGLAAALLLWLSQRGDNLDLALYVLLPFALSGAAAFMTRWAG